MYLHTKTQYEAVGLFFFFFTPRTMSGTQRKPERTTNLKRKIHPSLNPEQQCLAERIETTHLEGQLLLKAESSLLGWGHLADIFYCENVIIGTEMLPASHLGVKVCGLL